MMELLKNAEKRRKAMRKALLICLLFIGGVIESYAQDTIRGTYAYTYGDKESLVEARQTCKELALREAIESYAIFIESSTTVEDFQVKEDLIQSISTGYSKNVNIVEQREEGRTITMTVEASVDPEEVEELIESWAQKTTVSDSPGSETTMDAPSGRFGDIMETWHERTQIIDNDWKNKKYDEALSQIQRIRKWLDTHQPEPKNPFQQNLYTCFHTRILLQQDLIRVEKLEAQKNPIRARANMRLASRRAEVLRTEMVQFSRLQRLTDQQERLRSQCIRRNRSLIEVTNRKAKQYRIQ